MQSFPSASHLSELLTIAAIYDPVAFNSVGAVRLFGYFMFS